ncbi:hypothetical protein CSC18_0641 [Klebsiella aerogenes]|nr:hypothetical protein CSC18_0641 [Klebsiella aerogenes]
MREFYPYLLPIVVNTETVKRNLAHLLLLRLLISSLFTHT